MFATYTLPQQCRTQKQGFTLVELLVVIAIIGVLVSLLLPAVQAAREAARRSQCQNNIRNLALGVLNYESSYSELPASSSMDTYTRGRGATTNILLMFSSNQLSYLVRCLPYLEQQALYDQFDLDKSAFTQDVNVRPEEQQPSIFLCPSDDAQGLFYESATYSNGRRLAKGNYAAYVCPEHATSSKVWPGALIHEPQPLSRVTDGTSNSIMMAEVLTREELTDQRGAWTLAWPGASILAADIHGILPGNTSVNVSNATNPPSYIPSPTLAAGGLPPNTPPGSENADELRDCKNPSDADLQGMPCLTRSTPSNSAASRSNHVGGVNAANIDGSVRFLNDDVDVLVFGLMICINDGLPIAE